MSAGLRELATAWVASQEIEGERSDSEWLPIFAVQDLDSDPESLWEFVMLAEPMCRSVTALEMLGAGPLEDLIQSAGADYIDRIEAKAGSSARFSGLLRHVWVPASTDPLTQRYLALGCDQVRMPDA